MGKGRYLKAAERACARKARFETAAAAESFVDYRYRAYRCPVCGAYHLTSGRGDRREDSPTQTPSEPPGPKLGDLDWSAVLHPKPKTPKPPVTTPPPPKPPPAKTALCAGPCGKDGKALLVVDGKLIKSAKVDAILRDRISPGTEVEISPEPPFRILSVRP